MEEGRDPYQVLAEAQDDARTRKERLYARGFLPTEEQLLAELEGDVSEESRRRAVSRQVGVRLQQKQWDRLRLVAEWSGVTPTTMARILIGRGAKAVIDEELRYRRQFGPDYD
ncbi:MAG: hypothetical protein M3M99_01215 [Actinomycetota bacterium]|nr:hypothetical protein [Actinomycetota bacterium]